jgi:hypothetical protein
MHRLNVFLLALVLATVLLANAGTADAREGGRKLGQYSGFEGQEQVLGVAVAQTIREVSPSGGDEHDFSGREQALGYAVTTAIRTMNAESGYTHEMNDALVKMTLSHIQFAKDHGLLDEMIEQEMLTQRPMLERVGRMIADNGKKELALVAITDQTTCFYQLVPQVQRGPGTLVYRSPFGHVLEQTRRLGQHDLTEEEIHEIWTIPRVQGWSRILGVDIEVSEWREDGMVTLAVPAVQVAVSN